MGLQQYCNPTLSMRIDRVHGLVLIYYAVFRYTAAICENFFAISTVYECMKLIEKLMISQKGYKFYTYSDLRVWICRYSIFRTKLHASFNTPPLKTIASQCVGFAYIYEVSYCIKG